MKRSFSSMRRGLHARIHFVMLRAMGRFATFVFVFSAACGGGGDKKDEPAAGSGSGGAKVTAPATGSGSAGATTTAPVAGTPGKAPDVGVEAGGIVHDKAEGAAGQITAISGTVEVKRVGETKFAPAKLEDKLYSGDQLK